MNRELPILFNTDMVKAILDGRKTVTRRVMKPANPFRNKEGYCQGNGLWIDGYSENDEPNGHIKDYSVSSCWMRKKYYIEKYAPYQKGDILYVRETWQYLYALDGNEQIIEDTGRYYYAATDTIPFDTYTDSEGVTHENIPWRLSIHMPKAAARIWLKVTDVRVEQLQDMTLNDFLSEGISVRPEAFNDPKNARGQAKEIFIQVWNSTIKKADLPFYGWDANPYVWVIEFERCEKPERSDCL